MFALPAWLLFVGSSALSVRANIDYSTFSEIRIWTPVEEGNRFLNLRLQTSISSDLIIYQGVEDSRFQDSGPTETDTHRCIGKVMFKYNSDSPPQVVFNNTEMTVKPGTLGDVAKTAALCTITWAGGWLPPPYIDTTKVSNNTQMLNWWIGTGTDVDSNPKWKGVKIACSGSEDLRSLRWTS